MIRSLEDYTEELRAPDEAEFEARGGLGRYYFDFLEAMHAFNRAQKLPTGLLTNDEHCLQAATRAERAGEPAELVAATLFHDLFDGWNHDAFAAELLRPFVSEETLWIVQHHGTFQKFHKPDLTDEQRNERERYRNSPHFDRCAEFCASYDAPSFDADYDTLPLEHFRPLVEAFFAGSYF